MNIGNKIASLRKENSLSQEELAEKIGVARQTISKWELEETTPDIKQAKQLANIFNVSLDELVNNDINNILIKKVSNTEKLAEITIKLLRIMGISLIVLFVLGLAIFILFNFTKMKLKDRNITGKYSISCNLNNEEYSYEIEYNSNYQVINSGGDSYIAYHTEVESYDDANKAIAHIEDWFKDRDGSCIIKK